MHRVFSKRRVLVLRRFDMLTVDSEVKTSEELDFDGGDSDKNIATMAPEPPSQSDNDEPPRGYGCITMLIVITVMGWMLWQWLS